MCDAPGSRRVPLVCTPRPPTGPAAQSSPRRVGRPPSALRWEAEDDEDSQSFRLDRPPARRIARPLFFPVCELTDTEDATLMQPPLEAENEELEMKHWCRADGCSQQLSLDEGDCSQHNRRVRLDDPGAPTKKARGNGWRASGSAQGREENISASMLCESSGPSHVTVIEEVDESMDLPAHLSHLAVAPCATQKKLTFAPAIEEGNESNGKVNNACDARMVGMQLVLSRKRFLEERDADCGSTPPCSLGMPTASLEGFHPVKGMERKYSRVDDVNVTL